MGDRLISLSAAIDAVHKNYDTILDFTSDGKTISYSIEDILSELPSAQPVEDARAMCGECDAWNQYKNYPQPGWIPCSERLPYAECGESDTVLTTCGYRDGEDTSIRWTRLLYFNGGNWCYPTGETYEAKVYAWMPQPKPWKNE